MKKVLIPMANGNEDIELISIIDILTRVKNSGAKLELILASITNDIEITLDSGLKVKANTTLDKVDTSDIDAIVLAGGFDGMNNLKNDDRIKSIIQNLNSKGKLVAAICASPIVLANAGVLNGDFTCYPGCETGINANRLDKPVVVNNNVITGAGPITSIYFALAIVKELGFIEQFNGLSKGLLVNNFGIKF